MLHKYEVESMTWLIAFTTPLIIRNYPVNYFEIWGETKKQEPLPCFQSAVFSRAERMSETRCASTFASEDYVRQSLYECR